MLDLRDKIKEFVLYKVGNGEKISIWHDKWCEQGPLINIVSYRSIYDARFKPNANVAKMIEDGHWILPNEWYDKYLVLKDIQCPTINVSMKDKVLWINRSGVPVPYSTKAVWKDLMGVWPIKNSHHVVLFSQLNPKHAFILLILAAVIYYLWHKRNGRIFRQESRNENEICYIIKENIKNKKMSLKVKRSSVVMKMVAGYTMVNFLYLGVSLVEFSIVKGSGLVRIVYDGWNRECVDANYSVPLDLISKDVAAVLEIFETYVKSKDLDLWHVITYGNFPPIQNNPEAKKDEIVPFDKQNDDLKKKLAKNNEAKMAIYNALPLKDNKIDLLVQQYEQFTIPEEKSINNAFARFNTIITSLKALDEGYSSKNYVRKFLMAFHPKWRAKVTAIKRDDDVVVLENSKTKEEDVKEDESDHNKERYTFEDDDDDGEFDDLD
ncbi:hypothetical protein Tco_0214219 [Tanacetum coccineum]